MPVRRLLVLVTVLAALPIAACGDGSAFGCTGKVCKATFEGPGEQDLSSRLGKGATVAVVSVDGETVTVRVAGAAATLAKDEPRRIGGLEVTVTGVSGDSVDLRIVGS